MAAASIVGGSIAPTGGALNSARISAADSTPMRRTPAHPPEISDRRPLCWTAHSKPSAAHLAAQRLTSSLPALFTPQSYGCVGGGHSAFLSGPRRDVSTSMFFRGRPGFGGVAGDVSGEF